MAASNSIAKEIGMRIPLGEISSFKKIAIPMPIGIAKAIDISELTRVP